MLLANRILAQEEANAKRTGLDQDTFLKLAQNELLATTAQQLHGLISEFLEHDLIKEKKEANGHKTYSTGIESEDLRELVAMDFK